MAAVRAGPVHRLRSAGRQRSYLWPHDQPAHHYRSVTTICNEKDKPALRYWAARQAAEYAVRHPDASADQIAKAPWRERDRAAARGSSIHAAIEDPQKWVDSDIAPAVRQAYDLLSALRLEVIAVEVPVFSRSESYAGTVDAIVRGDATRGEKWLLDWKSGKGVWPDMALQLSAYAHAEWAGYYAGPETSYRADLWQPVTPSWSRSKALIAHITDSEWSAYVVPVDGPVWDAFRGLRVSKRWTDTLGQKHWWTERQTGSTA